MGVPTVVRSLLAALVATAASVAAGVVLVGPAEREAAPPEVAPSLTLADLDTTTLAATRAGFCGSVAPEHVVEALGAEPADATSYDNGEQVPLVGDLTDVAHEFGCTWTAADGGRARGWVFAPPVTADRAARLVRVAPRGEGCRRLPGAASYGVPSVAVVCPVDGGREVSYRGLFGDAWLSCALSAPATTPREELLARADRWCATVAVAGTAGSAAG